MRGVMRVAAVSGVLAMVALSGCTPDTAYRYTALSPAVRPLAWDGRTAKDGSLRVEGSLDVERVDPNLAPQLHDTALHAPDETVEGVVALAVAPGIEIGARYAFASYAWSEVTANGTPPIPGHPAVTGFGPEVRIAPAIDRRRRVRLGFAGNLMNYTVPYAEWTRATCTCPNNFVDSSAIGGGAAYSLVDQGTETHYALSIGVYPSVNLNDDGTAGHVFGGFAAHTGFKNDGFTNVNQSGSTLQDAGLVFFLTGGYGVEIDPMRVSAMLALPLTDAGSPVNYWIAGFVSVGVDIELWEGRERRRARAAPRDPTLVVDPARPAGGVP
jgi:hypothetical protein